MRCPYEVNVERLNLHYLSALVLARNHVVITQTCLPKAQARTEQ